MSNEYSSHLEWPLKLLQLWGGLHYSLLLMFRRLAILTTLLLIVTCCASAWVVRDLATAPFIAPGAANVQVSEVAPGQRQITYIMPNPDDGWQTAVARRLSLSGWSLAVDRYQWGGTETTTTIAVYARTSHLWFLEIRERVELLGDRSSAKLNISYTVSSRR